MERWSLKIERVNNGYILEGKFGNSDIKSKETIEEDDKELGELKAMQKLQWLVQEYFAVFNSKYNKFNLQVRIVDSGGKEIQNENSNCG